MKITDEMLSAAAPKARELLLDSLPPEEALPEIHGSAQFQSKMERLHRRWKFTRAAKTAARYLGRTAAVLLLLLGTASAGILTAAAVQGKALDLITHIYEEYITYQVEADPFREYVYKELYDIHLEYLPSNMAVAFRNKTISEYDITIRSELDRYPKGKFLNVYQRIIFPSDSFLAAFETGDVQPEAFTFSGFSAELYQIDDVAYLRWFDHNIYYQLSGNIGAEELKKVAENMIFYK